LSVIEEAGGGRRALARPKSIDQKKEREREKKNVREKGTQATETFTNRGEEEVRNF